MQSDQIIIYQTTDGQTAIDVKLENETIWLTLNQIADLFDKNKSTISRHLKNIFDEEELDHQSTVAKNATVQFEGGVSKERIIEYYNLDVIISVGYRVNSKRGTQFRIWANKVLKEYLIKGYSINEKRLKDQTEQFLSFRAQRRIFLNKRDGKVEIFTLTKVGNLPTTIYLWFMQVSRRRAASKKAWKYN